jgi:hypothetical protein
LSSLRVSSIIESLCFACAPLRALLCSSIWEGRSLLPF